MIKADINENRDTILVFADWRYKEACEAIPGARFIRSERYWRIPASWSACLALKDTFKDNLEVSPALSEWTQKLVDERINPTLALRDAQDAEIPDAENLFPYQRANVSFLMTAKQGLIGDEPGLGKAQDVDEPVLTPTGWTTMGQISVGDFVVGSDGKPTEVTGVFPQGTREVAEVVFTDGTVVRCDWDHLWTVQTPNDRRYHDKWRVKTTRELLEEGLMSGTKRKWRIPITSPVQFDQTTQRPRIPAYTLGALLGGGDLTDITPHIEGELNTWKEINDLGLRVSSAQKFIPERYLRGTVEDRVALLQGLMDKSGTNLSGRRGAKFPSSGITYTTVSPRLRDDVIELVQSLGGVATYYSRRTNYTQKRQGYIVNIALPASVTPFRLQRKLDRYKPRSKYQVSRRIKEIRSAGTAEMQCISVAADNSLYLTTGYVVTHNTLTSISALREAERQEPGSAFPAMVVAPASLLHNWQQEFEKWWPETTTEIITGTAAQRRKKLDKFTNPKDGEEAPQVLIIGWETLRLHSRLAHYGSINLAKCKKHGGIDLKISEARCEVHPKELNLINFNAVILDEAHRATNPKAKQTRALWAATGDAEYRFALTGTPITKDESNLWSLLHWMSPEEWPTKTKWIDRFIHTSDSEWGGTTYHGVFTHRRQEFDLTFLPRFKRNLKEVVLPLLPPKIQEDRIVEMSAKQAKAYKQMKTKMVAEVKDGTVQADSALVKATRLLQFASSYAEVEKTTVMDQNGNYVEKDVVRLTEPSSTLDAFVDDIEAGDFGESSVVVFAVSRQLTNLLSARMTKKGIKHGMVTGDQTLDERNAYVQQFQNGDFKWIIITRAGGIGLTFTTADTLVRLQRPWSMVDDKQLEDRVHRIGSEKHTHIRIVDYVTAGTIQEKVHVALKEKSDRMEDIVRDKEQILRLMGED